MRDPQWLYTWDSKEGMGGLDRISSGYKAGEGLLTGIWLDLLE